MTSLVSREDLMSVVSFCRLFGVVGAAGLVLAACSGDDAAGLTDSPWQASQYVDASGGLVDAVEGTTLSATFDGEQVAGSAGCNNYFGGYTTDGDAISIGPLASTQMFCEGAMDQEIAFLTAMQTADSYGISGDTLELKQGDTTMVVYEAAPGA
jgi:heat shock protein HslJ